MAFLYHKFDKGTIPPIEYHAGKTGETFTVGEALTLGDGGMTKCAATKPPTHICVGPMQSDGTVPATRVHSDIEYETELTVADAESALKLGNKVTLSADGLGVTTTTASGVATVVGIDGRAVNDKILVRF